MIREATPADSESLAALRYEFRSEIKESVEKRNDFIRRCSGWMSSRLSENWRSWVAVHEGEVVGQVWLHLIEKLPNCNGEPERHGYITNLYVKPECRGGVGKRLLGQSLEWAKQQRVDAIILWPTPRSRSLYTRHGFEMPKDLLQLRRRW